MGGEREAFLNEGNSVQINSDSAAKIRIHENRGEVHFHDDFNKLKCAVPCAIWYKAWTLLRTVKLGEPVEWSYIDVENNTMVLIKSSLDTMRGDRIDLHLEVSILSIIIDDNFMALDAFTRKS